MLKADILPVSKPPNSGNSLAEKVSSQERKKQKGLIVQAFSGTGWWCGVYNQTTHYRSQ
jgi:hypothetical protein